MGNEAQLIQDLIFLGRTMRYQYSEVMRIPYSRRVNIRDENIKIEEAQRDRMKGKKGSMIRNSAPGNGPPSQASRALNESSGDSAPQGEAREYTIKPPSSDPAPRRRNSRRPPRG